MHPHALEQHKNQAEFFLERIIDNVDDDEKKEKLIKILDDLKEIEIVENEQ